jgi:TonB family protein
MAPLKEADTIVATGAPTSTENAGKSSADAASRTQPVALEIPVTINGAHTVAGSDKREPFSEATQTVLVFAHGAVVRVNSSLAPGQLVFLTNEKSKKEVVCQVLKSKSGGSSGNYVELQFTEPAPGFWGLRMAGGPATAPTSVAPRPGAPAPVPPKLSAVPPAPQSTVSKPVALPPAPPKSVEATPAPPKVSAPLVSVPPPAPISAKEPTHVETVSAPKTTPKPSDTSSLKVSPPTPTAVPAPPAVSVPLISVPPPAPLGDTKDHSAAESAAPAVTEKKPAAPSAPVLHDYAKEIDALFATPSSTTVPAAPSQPVAPSSEQLKLEAARLQAQLSSMLFSETSASTQAAPPPAAQKPAAPPSVRAQQLSDIAQDQPKPAPVAEHKLPIAPEYKPALPSMTAEEQEVKMPAWLSPLSHNEAPTSEKSSVSDPASEALSTDLPESSEDAPRSQAAVFGGQLLGAAESQTEKASGGSKTGLWIGIAAVVVLSAAAGTWYMRSNSAAPSNSTAQKQSNPPIVSSPAVAHPEVDSKPSSATVESSVNSAPAPVTAAPAVQSTRISAPTPSQALTSAAARELKTITSKNSNPAPSAAPPPVAPEPEEKSALGSVKLASPVVKGGSASQQSSVALPSLDVPQANANSYALGSVGSSAPSVPLPVGGEVQAAQLVKSVPPIYPSLAKSQHVAGNVQLDALIDTSGNVAQVKVISGPGLLHGAALDAVKQWKYKPAMLNGEPTTMHLTVTVQFRAQ